MSFKFIFLSLSILIFNTKAHAYLDPGSGSIILQAIIGAIAAGGVTIKIYWHKLKVLFKKKKKNKDF